MNYPKTLKIGDRTYRVRFVKSIRGCKKTGKGALVGFYDPRRLEILIKDVGQSKDEILKALIHEVIHGIHNEYGIRLSHKGVYKMEEAFFDFLSANSDSLFSK